MAINTFPEEYVVELVGHIRMHEERGRTPSNRVLAALQQIEPSIQLSGFRKAVLNAIFEDAVIDHFGEEDRAKNVVGRLKRRFGKTKARRFLCARCEILESWRHRDVTLSQTLSS